VGGVILAIVVVVAVSWDIAAERRASREAEADSATAEAEPEAGGAQGARGPSRVAYRVPPLDLPHYHGIGVTTSAGAARTGAAVNGVGDTDGTKEVTGA
jgi:hypothetical protein